MKVFPFLIMAVIATANSAGRLAPGLRVKFKIHGTPDKDSFFKVPRTAAEADSEGWTLTARPEGILPELVMYCPADKVVCVLMDDTEYVAGLQIAIRKDKFTENVLDWDKRGFTSWKTNVDGQTVMFWTIQAYFVSKEGLKKSKRERLSTRDSSGTLQEGAVWFTGVGHQLLKVSTIEDHLQKTIFTKQACIPGMGNHYFYNMTTRTECVAEQIYPWFLLTFRGEIIGAAFSTIGKLQLDHNERDWMERPELPIIKAVLPYGPECVYNWASKPGMITLHIYFVDDPRGITCDTPKTITPELPKKQTASCT